MRAFQDWTRAEIAERQIELRAGTDELKQAEASIEQQMKATLLTAATEMERLMIRSRATSQSSELLDRIQANLREIRELNTEVHIRDSPELVREFGPGKD